MKHAFTIAMALSVITVPVLAQETAPTPPTDGSKQEKKICRSEKMTGSLTRRTRICMTAAEWREFSVRNKQGIDDMNRSASGGKMCVPDPRDPFQGCS